MVVVIAKYATNVVSPPWPSICSSFEFGLHVESPEHAAMKRNGSLIRRSAHAVVASFLLAGCGGGPNGPPPTTGTVAFSVVAIGNGVDPDGITVTIADFTGVLKFGQTLYARNLKPDTYTAMVSGVASHCFATQQRQTVSVAAAKTTTVKFAIECYGDIAFVRHNSTTDLKILYVAPTGEAVPLAANLPGRNFLEAWSPDGTRLLFTNEANDNTDIYTVKPDGSGLTRVTVSPDADLSPRWSPDGGRIVFYRRINQTNTSALYVVNADGSGARRVLDALYHDRDPSWAPDGSRIAFACDRFGAGGVYDVCSVAPDGSGLRRIAAVGDALFTAWSPDGSRVAYRSLGGVRIWVASVDAAALVNLSPPVPSFGFDWSPDGSRLLLSVSDGTIGFATVSRDGTNYARLPLASMTGDGDWSPDGTKVVADIMFSGRRVIAVMNPDGTDVRPLEPVGNVTAYRPLWNPKTRLTLSSRAAN